MDTLSLLLGIVAVLVALLVALVLVPAAHVAAHAVGARRSGLRVVDFRAFPVQVRRTGRGLRVRVFSGFQGPNAGVLVDPFSVEDAALLPAMAGFARAGTLGLGAWVGLGFGLLLVGRWVEPLVWVGVATVVAAVAAGGHSLLRGAPGAMRTDGWAAATFGHGDAAAVGLANACRINYFTDFARTRPRDYPAGLVDHARRRWELRDLRRSEPDEALACGRVMALVHLDRGEWTEAGAVLDGMAEVGAPTPGDGRHMDWVHLHRAIVAAAGRGDAEAARAALRAVRPIAGAKHLALHDGARAVVELAAGGRAKAASLAAAALEATAGEGDLPGQTAMQRELWQYVAHHALYGDPGWAVAR